MNLDFIIGGVPRGGTTVAAKFMSLHRDIFCYAGETHIVPLMLGMFDQLPCRKDKIDIVTGFLHQQLTTAMIEMPRFSVSNGAHPGNLIFNENDIDCLINVLRENIISDIYGEELYNVALSVLRDLLSRADKRVILGEKTPNNIFSMANFSEIYNTKNIVVMREPIGVIRSMKSRVEKGDAYSADFKGDIERNIGVYMEYAKAAKEILNSNAECLLVRYEDMALAPDKVLRNMYKLFNREPEECVIRFVEGMWDQDIADRAPMNYRRLNINTKINNLTQFDIWKIFNLTRKLRESFGYSDCEMEEMGFETPVKLLDMEVPTTIMPLYGFYPEELFGGYLMKRKGGLIVYLSNRKHHYITLFLKSKFPHQIEGEIDLQIYINNKKCMSTMVAVGKQAKTLYFRVESDDIFPIGKSGGYLIIELESSKTYCPICHTANGTDMRSISFRLVDWKIENITRKLWRLKNNYSKLIRWIKK